MWIVILLIRCAYSWRLRKVVRESKAFLCIAFDIESIAIKIAHDYSHKWRKVQSRHVLILKIKTTSSSWRDESNYDNQLLLLRFSEVTLRKKPRAEHPTIVALSHINRGGAPIKACFSVQSSPQHIVIHYFMESGDLAPTKTSKQTAVTEHQAKLH